MIKMTVETAPPIQTKWGTAKVGNTGYYTISENSKGHYGELLHRLLFEDFYKINLHEEFPEGVIIHHVDGNKLNNEIWNLIPLSREEHNSVHHKNKELSEEHKQKIRESNLGRVPSEETRRKISKSNKGKPAWNKGVSMTEEAKKKLSNSMKGRVISEETRRKLSEAKSGEKNYWYGKKLSKKHKKKLSESHLGNIHSEETKRKMSESQKGKTHSLESKLKLSEHKNKTGFFNVFRLTSNQCKQGFTWAYYYYKNNKRKMLSSVSLKTLKNKVLKSGLDWIIIDEQKAIETCNSYGYDFKEII